MALITATYVSTTSFTVANDLTADFVNGQAVYMDCGVDGIKYGFVDYSSYSSPNTTIYLNSNESQAITANLTGCYFGRVKFKENYSNIPVQILWMMRGFKQGMSLSWKDSDEFYVDAGARHIDDGASENIYRAPGQLTKSVTGLSVSTWYAVYAKAPTNGLILTASQIEYASTMPTYDQAKGGYYHPSSTGWRCIGFFDSNSSGNINPFVHSGGKFMWTDEEFAWVNGVAPSETWTTITCGVPIGNVIALANTFGLYSNAYTLLYCRRKGDSGSGFRIGHILSPNSLSINASSIPVDASKQAEIKWYGSSTNTVYIQGRGFVLPSSI